MRNLLRHRCMKARSLKILLFRVFSGFILSLLFVGNLLVLPVHAAIDPLTAAGSAAMLSSPGLPTKDTGLQLNEATKEPKAAIKTAFGTAAFMYLMNLLSFALDRAAYDSAVAIASGAAGEGPLFDRTPLKEIGKEYSAAVAGEALGLLQEDLENIDGDVGAVFKSFNLCAPDVEVTLALSLGVRSAFQRPTPKCDFNKIKSDWSSFVADLEEDMTLTGVDKNKVIIGKLAEAMDPQTNNFSVGITLQSSILNKALHAGTAAEQNRIANDGFVDLTEVITGKVNTPAAYLNRQYQDDLNNKSNKEINNLEKISNNWEILAGVGIQAASTFTNTLLSQFTKRVYEGLFDFQDHNLDPFAGVDSIAKSNAQTAREKYRSLLAFTPLTLDDYSILNEFATCPNGVNRGLYNCVTDASLVSAVGRAAAGAPMTVKEALDEGLLHGDWPLIPSTDLSRNQDPFCYTYGYCSANLVKLRKARIIPVGWEMAAESSTNSQYEPVTLQEVINGFNDPQSPWYKLIDPNWVFKYPETQCKAMVPGQLLLASGVGERQQECVDMPSCIAEGDDGSCVGGYGYCVKEENTWHFRGESCPAQFASCLTFDNGDKSGSYLQNTVDYAGCSADNAGCLWYNTQKADPENDGAYDWQPVDDVAAADADLNAYQSRIYFTSAVEECDSANGGCSELVARNDGLSLNVLRNSSFEADSNNDNLPDAWLSATGGAAVNVDNARSGGVAVTANGMSQPGLVVSQGQFYTLSFYAKQKAAAATAVVRSQIQLVAEGAGNEADLRGTSVMAGANTTCFTDASGDYTSATTGADLDDLLDVSGTPTSDTYERFSCTFTAPILADAAARVVAKLYLGGDVYIDDIQLEQGEIATGYHDGYSTFDAQTLTVKVPPAYLGCQGTDADPEECANYAEVCSANDVGCTAYTPTNGDPTVTGVASELDYCPAVCSGYDTFKQEPTLYEPEGSFPVYFIPTTGDTCSDEYVGCDEFTNLTNEAQEYYTYLRACLTTSQAATNTGGDKAATFYTWEGSDLEGYQLKTWSLLESNMGATAYTYVSGGTDSSPDLAPCSIWTSTADGIVCSDGLDTDGDLHKDWDTAICDDHDDIFTNPDCREFYDTNGGIHYRLWSKTVTVSDSCSAYRKTDIVGVDTAAQIANCQASGGYFDDVVGSCRYYGYADESLSCPVAANGCREYTGGRSRNSRVVLDDTFEDGSLSIWDTFDAAAVTLSNESLAVNGHSIAATGEFNSFMVNYGKDCATPGGCPGVADSLGGECTVIEGRQYCGTLEGELYSGKTYTLSFWAKGSGTLSTGFDLARGSGVGVPTIPTTVPVGGLGGIGVGVGTGSTGIPGLPSAGVPASDVPFGAASLTSDWQEFTYGPIYINARAYPNFGEGTRLQFIPTDLAYVDNIVLREGEDNITLIKNSWSTPAVCDQSPTSAPSPQYYLGCSEYTTQTNDTVYLKSFSRLCDESKVGCENYFLTQESASPYAQVFQATCENPSGSAVTAPTACYYQVTTLGAFDATSPYLCTIGIGQTSCTFDMDWYEDQAQLPSHISYGPATVVVPADSDIYLIADDAHTCNAAYAGCTEVGKPNWSQDKNSTTGAESVYLMNDPDRYGEILCSHDELFCSAWDTDNSGTFFFKDPGDQTCDYRTNTLVNGAAYDGWFRTGTNDFCYGTCTDGVTGCSSDAQCGAGTCNLQDPSYLSGGSTSNIWRNGDDKYLGWVGSCSDQYSTCSEFQDPLDVQGDGLYGFNESAAYYYLAGDNLGDTGSPSSQKCNGQVSLTEGCVLFNDTAKTYVSYNTSATDVLSRHADTLLGKSTGALVNPVDCGAGNNSTYTLANGTTIDLCTQRCSYDAGAVNDTSDGVLYRDKLASGETDLSAIYLFGNSCLSRSDCAPLTSESGETIEALDCASQVAGIDTVTGTEIQTDTPSLTNDANTVLKVNRDRQCSEWLTCADANPVWDERTGAWKTVCSSLSLCNEYSALEGGASFCSSIDPNDPEVVLNQDYYAARDTSWYGVDYSGYAVPDLFPVQSLEQVNVAEDLKADPVYRLALVAGSCDSAADYGAACTIGKCENTGAACSSNGDCPAGAGACVVGQCQASTGQACVSNDDCAAGDICSAAECVTPSSDLVTVDEFNADPDSPCADIFAQFNSFHTGGCIHGQCLLTPNGETFNTEDTEGKLCRAQPESNSPFGNNVVERWKDPETGNTPSASDPVAPESILSDDQPYEVLNGFESVSTCARGEDCVCSYRKVTYEDAGAITYFDNDSGLPPKSGVCTSGKTKMACANDEECDSGKTTTTDAGSVPVHDGTCSKPSREDVYLGLDGYCLEKDSSINIEGDRSKNACLTWLPVDQLAGSTDLYAKFTEAGYFTDTFACTETVPMANLVMSSHNLEEKDKLYSIACAESDEGSITKSNAFALDKGVVTACAANSFCPDGYWTMMGMASYRDSGVATTMSAACVESTSGGEGNDCPYVCIPNDATIVDPETNATESCNPDDNAYMETLFNKYASVGLGGWSHDGILANGVKFVGVNIDGLSDSEADAAYTLFDNMVAELSECSRKGVEVDSALNDAVFNQESTNGTLYKVVGGSIEEDTDKIRDPGATYNEIEGERYRDLYLKAEFYPACSEVTRVSDGTENRSYAWTDRLLGPKTPLTFTVDSNQGGFDFGSDTRPTKYGFIKATPGDTGDEWPLVTAACQDQLNEELIPPWSTSIDADTGTVKADYNTCGAAFSLTQNYEEETDPHAVLPSETLKDKLDPARDTALARSFVDFFYTGGERTNRTLWDLSLKGSYDDIYQIVNQLFAGINLRLDKTFNEFAWNGIGASWPSNDLQYTGSSDLSAGHNNETNNFDYDVRAEEGRPPTVWSLKTSTCTGTECEEDRADALTVNGQNANDQSSMKFFRANLQFYAAANTNQLPIRRVIVDWGDGNSSARSPSLPDMNVIGSEAADNFFKNHRGLQIGSKKSICDRGNEWGETPDSCDPNYFNYSHIYSCTEATLKHLPTCQRTVDGVLTNSPCSDTDPQTNQAACFYQPRVHIRDNWGWCTGVCTDADGTAGCYEGNSQDTLNNPADPLSECGYANANNNVGGPRDSWVYYDGQIVVNTQ